MRYQLIEEFYSKVKTFFYETKFSYLKGMLWTFAEIFLFIKCMRDILKDRRKAFDEKRNKNMSS